MEAFKYIVDVDSQGQISVPEIPQIKSTKVEVIILPLGDDDSSEILQAAESSIEFWENQEDEVWNNV